MTTKHHAIPYKLNMIYSKIFTVQILLCIEGKKNLMKNNLTLKCLISFYLPFV